MFYHTLQRASNQARLSLVIALSAGSVLSSHVLSNPGHRPVFDGPFVMNEAPSTENDPQNSQRKKKKKSRANKAEDLAFEQRDAKLKRDGSSSELFEGQCLKRQLHVPKVPYPAWDYNWDGRMTEKTSFERLSTEQGLRESRKGGTVRHLILIRHGQYDESHKDDSLRTLTPLGRRQAEQTGKRLAMLATGASETFDMDDEERNFHRQGGEDGPCLIKAIHVSNMTRAKETAAIIAKQLPASSSVAVNDPDPLLNEALPSPMIPARPDVPEAVKEVDENHDRIEQAFQKYFFRATPSDDDDDTIDPTDGQSDDDVSNKELKTKRKHEFEVIVGHGNVIRYFLCRALQLPPEAWLRIGTFNCSITYIVIQPNGYVSVRLVGDTGHLVYEETTFSGYHGYNW